MKLAAAAGLIFAIAGPVNAADEPVSIYAAAQEYQAFYPVGFATVDDRRLDFYVMGTLSVKSEVIARGAILVNTATGKGEHIQIVELQSVACSRETIQPTYRLVLNSKGQMLQGSGPVASEGDEAQSLLPPEAMARTIEILCHAAKPTNVLENRTLADFR
ncbi:hypothetical protein [Caulobacter sp. UNC279MFTsu5.1]|uniref:hypothetical protein n=1 Tax=Caulobacter sp. UNC279MFTsu5.1 TaxID=1502775 RepID=UPI0004771F80|nr:hypothetical protein [Caulobacter sp. UNC279MFTsu5.1]